MKRTSPTIHRIPITQARVNLGSVVRRVHNNKEYFILEKDGIPVAGLMDADELEDYLELQDPKVREHIRKSRAEQLAGQGRPISEFLTELDAEAGRRRTTTKPRSNKRRQKV